MALGFLPLAIVRINFNQLWRSGTTRRLIRRFPALEDFFIYFNNNYINGNFPPRIWNVHNRPMEIRTNNHVESYHRRWNQAIGVKHPKFWSFIRVLKNQDKLNNNKPTVRAIRNGVDPPRRRFRWSRLEENRVTKKEQYNAGQIYIHQYWKATSYAIRDN